MTEPESNITEEEVLLLLADLVSPDVKVRLAVLKVLAVDPAADQRVATVIEPLLDDYSPCMLTIPPSYSELRWMASACERGSAR